MLRVYLKKNYRETNSKHSMKKLCTIDSLVCYICGDY